jgi:uncharacterized protein (DUF924 family)
MTTLESWSSDVLQFWFAESGPERWFNKKPAFDVEVRQRFLALPEALAPCENASLLTDPRTALAGIIVFDQMSCQLSCKMFRDTPRAFATDPRALWLAQEAIARGFDTDLTKDERVFVYLPFEHSEGPQTQARCVALMATLNDPELTTSAEPHQRIIDRFGRLPLRNSILGRGSTTDEIESLTQPGSSF